VRIFFSTGKERENVENTEEGKKYVTAVPHYIPAKIKIKKYGAEIFHFYIAFFT